MELGLKDKVAVVFAASKGLGKATAFSLAKEGCNIAICSSNRQNIENTANEIREAVSSDVFPAVVDLFNKEQIEEFLDMVIKRWGKVDILITNVGGPPVKSFEETTNDEWLKYFQLIVMSVIASVRKVLPGMKNQNWGRIINITSSAVKQPFMGLIYSNSLRSAVVGLNKTLSQEFGKYDIHFHNVAPGFFKTDGLERIVTKRVESGESKDNIYAEWKKDVPLNRIGNPEELAALIVFLASEAAGYMNGNTILVDGGKFSGMY